MPGNNSEEDDQSTESRPRERHQILSFEPPASLVAPISPPLKPSARKLSYNATAKGAVDQRQGRLLSRRSLAAAEAGKFHVCNHLSHFSAYLSRFIRSSNQSLLHLCISDFRDLYTRNLHPKGRHFVIHQHDHPIAGLHYDLRLQINETSSVSWAIMYGLPGNVDSRRLNRNATETRIHSLWVGSSQS